MPSIDRAVVVGASMGGLAAAATLARRFREVVLIERRPIEPGRSVAPQGHLPHVLLLGGSRVLEGLFPGFAEDLLGHGASDAGTHAGRTPCFWAAAGVVRRHLAVPDLGFRTAMCSRALVESRLRSATEAIPGVGVVRGSVSGLIVDGTRRVRGVVVPGVGTLEADVVVDASGRSGRVEDWMRSCDLAVPPTTDVAVDLRYTGYVVERRSEDFDGGAFAVVQNDAAVSRIGVALPMEGDRWQVVLGGYFGEAAPTDAGGARTFASTLATPALTPLFERPFLTEPARYTFSSSRRRRWELVRDMPRGMWSIGDSVASFNPLYGQGMSAALLQAETMGAAIDRFGNSPDLAKVIARATAKVVDNPWTVATGADFVYRQTRGRRPPGANLVNRYLTGVMRSAPVDETVNLALTAVQQMLAPPSVLFHPRIVARTVRSGRQRPDLAVAAS